MNFVSSQEKHIDKIYKKLVDSISVSQERRRHLKPVENRPGMMFNSCKVQQKCVDSCPPFRPILSALQAPTYKLAKYLVPILESLATNKYTVKDSVNFTTEVVKQDSISFMGTLNMHSLFTNMPLEEIIEICTSNPFKKNGVVHGLKKVVESHFIFNNTSYKQFDVGAMASPLGSSLANACLVHYKQNWLDSCPLEYKPL